MIIPILPISLEKYLSCLKKVLKRLKWYVTIIFNALLALLGLKKATFSKENQLRKQKLIVNCSECQ